MAARKRAARRSPPARKGRGCSRVKSPKTIEEKIEAIESEIRKYATIKYRKARNVTDEVKRTVIVAKLKATKIRVPKTPPASRLPRDPEKREAKLAIIEAQQSDARKAILDERGPKIRKLSKDLAALTALRYPGKKGYRDRHFVATFTGKEYIVDPNDRKRKIVVKNSTYGSGANENVTKVREDFDRRMKGILEGQTAAGSAEDPKTAAQGYGVFREGPMEIEMSIYEREDEE